MSEVYEELNFNIRQILDSVPMEHLCEERHKSLCRIINDIREENYRFNKESFNQRRVIIIIMIYLSIMSTLIVFNL